MVFAQITLIGFLILKQTKYAGPALDPLLGLSVLFILYLIRSIFHVSIFLPTRNGVLKDKEKAIG